MNEITKETRVTGEKKRHGTEPSVGHSTIKVRQMERESAAKPGCCFVVGADEDNWERMVSQKTQ